MTHDAECFRTAVFHVLQQFAPSSHASDWLIDLLNAGPHALVFAVRRRDGGLIVQTHRELAVKLYRPEAWHGIEVAQIQFESMADFHARLDGYAVSGWRICEPTPFFQSKAPLALVMTRVPGRSLNFCLKASDQLPTETLDSLANALVAALDRYWSLGSRTYGDLNLDNVLCDLSARTLSFVDPGVLQDGFHCDDVSRQFFPASRDLAFLLFDTSSAVKKNFGKPRVRRSQNDLLQKILEVYLQSLASREQQQLLLDEIRECVQVHLQRLQVSLSPRGTWHRLLRWLTSHRIKRLFSRARAAADLKRLPRATDHHSSEQNVPMANGKTGRITAMASLANGHQASPAPANLDTRQTDGPGRILLGVFECFDRAGIPYCVLHGYGSYPERITKDVDCLISADVTPEQVAALLYKHRELIGAEIVRSRGYYFNLAGKNSSGSACFLELDLSVDFEMNGRQFYRGDEVLAGRRRHGSFWVSAADVEFGCYLVKKIAKRQMEAWQTQRLSELFRQDPEGCRKQVARFWSEGSAALILAAAGSGDWQPVRRHLRKLAREVRRGATLRHPLQVAQHWLRRMGGRFRRALRPDSGLDVVFLGPDGAGKTSVVHGVTGQLAGAFARTACYSFPPALLHRLHRARSGPEPLPHDVPLRSWPASVLRAVAYWFVYSTLGYLVTVHLALARAGLVVHDRHLFDTLVDPRRYRYGGPLWLLRLICRLVPKPDLVFLLDAPPEVLHARKQEIAFDETARQRQAYVTLVSPMRNGHVVDATRPLEQVVGEVNEIILHHVATRTERRFRMPVTV